MMGTNRHEGISYPSSPTLPPPCSLISIHSAPPVTTYLPDLLTLPTRWPSTHQPSSMSAPFTNSLPLRLLHSFTACIFSAVFYPSAHIDLHRFIQCVMVPAVLLICLLSLLTALEPVCNTHPYLSIRAIILNVGSRTES